MTLVVNGIEIPEDDDNIIVNGVKVTEVICDNVVVWKRKQESILATGGTITEVTVDGDLYRVHTFKESGTFSVIRKSTDSTFDYLLVGSGGGGGSADSKDGNIYSSTQGYGGEGKLVLDSTDIHIGNHDITVGPAHHLKGSDSKIGNLDKAIGGRRGNSNLTGTIYTETTGWADGQTSHRFPGTGTITYGRRGPTVSALKTVIGGADNTGNGGSNVRMNDGYHIGGTGGSGIAIIRYKVKMED